MVQEAGILFYDDFNWGPWISGAGSLWEVHHGKSGVLSGLMKSLALAFSEADI